MTDNIPADRTADMPDEIRDKMSWCGECVGDSGNTWTNVVWNEPEGFDWAETGYQAGCTDADCDLAEQALSAMYPDSLYTSHTGYGPENRWPEESIDSSLRKKAWG